MTLFTKPAPGEWIKDPESGRSITTVPTKQGSCTVDDEGCVFRGRDACRGVTCVGVIYVEQPAFARLRLLGLGK